MQADEDGRAASNAGHGPDGRFPADSLDRSNQTLLPTSDAAEVDSPEQTAEHLPVETAGDNQSSVTAEAISEEPRKNCCICGLDVSQKKRSRDRAGRYWCAYCHGFIYSTEASPATTPCPECGRNTRHKQMVERDGDRVCVSCNQICLDECTHRLAHKAAVTFDPELTIRGLIRKLCKGLIALAGLAALLTLYHFDLLYFRPQSWVPFVGGLYAFAIAAIGIGIAIGVQYIRIALRKRARRAAYDKMVQAAANQILMLDEEAHTLGVSEPPEPLRRRVERAVARVEACAGQGVLEAGEILETLADKGEPTPLIQFLLAQRPNTTDTVGRNREIATICYLQRDLDTARAAVVAILLRLPQDQDAMTRQALISYRNGELEQSKKIFKRVVFIAREKNHEIDLAAAYCNLGMLHLMLSEFDDAAVRYSQAMQIYTRLNREPGQADCLVSLGLIAYRKKEKGPEIEVQFRRAMSINKRHKRLEGMAICCNLLGVILTEKEVPKLNEAERLQKKAVRLNLELSRPGGVATAYGNLGLVRVKRGDLAGARELFLKAQSIYQRINRPKMMAKIQDMLKTVGTISAARAANR